MPRSRGGARQGVPGRAYTNRSDLSQAPRAAPSESYGEGEASLNAQRAMPLPMMPAPPMPGAMPLNRPSERPAEPVTSGMAMGAGPGPSAVMPAFDPVVEALRAAYRAFPNESIAALLEAAESAER